MSTAISLLQERNPTSTTVSRVEVPILLLLLTGASVPTNDYPLSLSATEQGLSDEVHQALRSIEPFGNPYGMAAILLAIVAMAPGNFVTTCRIGNTGVAGGLSAGVV